MQYLYGIQPTRLEVVTECPAAEEAPIVGEHSADLEARVQSGCVPFGIMDFRAAGEAEARAIRDGDPAVNSGMMRAELFSYSVALRSAAGPT